MPSAKFVDSARTTITRSDLATGRARMSSMTPPKKSPVSKSRTATKRAAAPPKKSIPTRATKSSAAKPAPDLVDPSLAQRAYERLLPAYRALPSTGLPRITIDVAHAATVALRAIDQLEPLRPAFAAALRDFDVRELDHLRDLALGAWYAALQARPTVGSDDFDKLVAEGNELREQFVVASAALAARKLFDAKTLADLRNGVGYRDLAGDLTTFATIYTKNRSRYTGKTAIEPREVKRAAEIGTLLFEHAAKRQRSANALSAANDIKQRAWALLTQSYDRIRRAVTYVRWAEGDADVVTPSLFAIPGSGRHAASDHAKPADATTSSTNTDDDDTVTTPHRAARRTSGVHAAREVANEEDSSETPVDSAAAGRRGGNPFG
jgi:hypothetical protein